MRTSIALCLTFALTACGGNNTPLHSDTGDLPQATDTPTGPSDSGDTIDSDLLPLPGHSDSGPTGASDSACDDTACDTDLPDDTCDSAGSCPPIDPPWDSGCDSAETDTDCQPGPCALTFEITTVDYAHEMSIDIEDRDGHVIAQWPPSNITPSDDSSYSWTVRIDPDDITIALIDAFGDGWNGGHVTVTDSAGNVIASTTASDFDAGVRYDIDHRHDCGGTFTVDSGDTFQWPTIPPCTMEFSWNATSNWAYADAFFSVYDEDGNEVFTESFDDATSWNREEVLASGTYYAVMNYEGGFGALGNPFEVTEVRTGASQASLTMDLAGYDWEWFSVACDDDTAWVGLETGWSAPAEGELPPGLTPFWSDTQDTALDGTCTFLLQMVGPPLGSPPHDYSRGGEISWYLFDDHQNLLDRMMPGDVATNRAYERPITLTAGRYLFNLRDTAADGWEGGYLRVVTPDGDIIENLTLESGSEDHVYLDLECEGAAHTGWDTSAGLPTNDTGWWSSGPYRGCPLTLSMNTDGSAWDMDFAIVDTVTGMTVYSTSDAWIRGIHEAGSPQQASLALPTGTYELELLEQSAPYTGWSADAWVRLYDDAGSFVAGGGHTVSGTTTSTVYPFTWSCATDSAAWTGSELDALRADTGWSMGPGWYDTDVPEGCGHMVEVLTPSNPLGGGWELYDDAGTLLYSVATGSMTQANTTYHTPVQLPSGGYRFRMLDTNGAGYAVYGHPQNFRIHDDSGHMVESFGMGGWGVTVAEEWFVVDCEDDTSGWTDSGWCPPTTIDTSTGSMGGPCDAFIEVVADYDFNQMGVTIEDDAGHVLFDLQPGDLTNPGTYHYAFSMPSGGYHVLLEDSTGYTWSSSASVSIKRGEGCASDFETLAGPWKLDYSNDEAIGGQWDTWLDYTCDADTSVWSGWDSGWCEPVLDSADFAQGACAYMLVVRSGYDHADMEISIEDSSGTSVFDISAGDLTDEDMYHFPLNLPTDGYTITWSDASTHSETWDYDAWFQLVPAEPGSACLEAAADSPVYTLPWGYGGTRTEHVALHCAEDTSDTFFQWDSGWCTPVLDSGEQPTGACGYVLEVRADYDHDDMVVELSDSEGNLLVDIKPGDLTSSGYHYYPVNLPTDGYHLHLEDVSPGSANWGSNAHVRLLTTNGACLDGEPASESYTVSEFGELDAYFVLGCEEDTGDSFSWDSGWCEPILDSGEVPTGDCAYVLEVTSDYDYMYMAINLTDADGNELLDIAAGDITSESVTYYPVNLPTNGYTLTLLDDYPWSVSSWGPDAHVRVIPVDDDCFDPDVEAEEWRVDVFGEEIIHFEVDCADDTAAFAWDSAWCDAVVPDTAALTGCEQLIDVSAYNGYQMGIEIADSSGNVIFDIDHGDLGWWAQYLYAVDMPTGGYQLTLTDASGYGWDWYPDPLLHGSLTIWEGNGVCAGEEALFGPYTLPDANGSTDTTPNEAVFNLWVDCDADTSTAAVDTTWMGDSTWSPAQDTQESGVAP